MSAEGLAVPVRVSIGQGLSKPAGERAKHTSLAVGSKSLFSIRTLYDVIDVLLPKALAIGREERKELQFGKAERLPDDRIEYYYSRASEYSKSWQG